MGNWVATTTISGVSYSFLTPNSLFPVSDNDVWFVFNKEIWHYNGTSWSKNYSTTNSGENFKAVFFVNQNLGWVIGGSGTIYTYNGISWSKITSSAIGNSALLDIVATSSNDIWISGYGQFFHYDGNEWTKFTVAGYYINDMELINSDDIWALDDHGRVLKYNGIGWALIKQLPSSSSGYFQNISALSDADLRISCSILMTQTKADCGIMMGMNF